jgi:hypothetical protein
MPGHRERRWPWITAGYTVLLLVVAALTAFIYDSAAPENRSDVIRFAVAFVVAVILIHLRSYFRGDPRWDPPSPFEDALTRQPAVPKLDSGFTKLREEVANSLASRSYFEKVLWPRLSGLAEARGLPNELRLPASRGWWGRGWWRRGPSGRAIAALIAQIERGR